MGEKRHPRFLEKGRANTTILIPMSLIIWFTDYLNNQDGVITIIFSIVVSEGWKKGHAPGSTVFILKLSIK